MTGHTLLLSTCGTSLLTNGRSDQDRQLINRYSNERKPEALPADVRTRLDTIINDVRDTALKATPGEIVRMSAELHALVRWYDYRPFPAQDVHVLLYTDTWLGERAAQIVEAYLCRQGCQQVIPYRQKDLQTADLSSFQLALSEIVKWLEELLSDYQHRGYRIVFNLTGGFKSVQGFLQALAPFYADEVIYIFESQQALLRIPRLPVRLVATETVREHLHTIRRLSLGLPVAETELDKLPETLLMRVNGDVALSAWGEVIWGQERKTVYGEKLLPSPDERLVFGPQFERSVRGLPPDRLALVNERIDDLARYLVAGHNRKALDVKPLRGNPRPPSTHECNAWSDRDARRIFVHYEGAKLVLDALDRGLH